MADPNRAERDRAVLELRRAGHTYAAIAARMGLASKSAAHAAFHRALAGAPTDEEDEVRAGELDRLDRLSTAVWAAAVRGDVRAVDRCLRIIEQRCRLLGLDAAPVPASAPVPPPPAPPASALDDLLARRGARRDEAPTPT